MRGVESAQQQIDDVFAALAGSRREALSFAEVEQALLPSEMCHAWQIHDAGASELWGASQSSSRRPPRDQCTAARAEALGRLPAALRSLPLLMPLLEGLPGRDPPSAIEDMAELASECWLLRSSPERCAYKLGVSQRLRAYRAPLLAGLLDSAALPLRDEVPLLILGNSLSKQLHFAAVCAHVRQHMARAKSLRASRSEGLLTSRLNELWPFSANFSHGSRGSANVGYFNEACMTETAEHLRPMYQVVARQLATVAKLGVGAVVLLFGTKAVREEKLDGKKLGSQKQRAERCAVRALAMLDAYRKLCKGCAAVFVTPPYQHFRTESGAFDLAAMAAAHRRSQAGESVGPAGGCAPQSDSRRYPPSDPQVPEAQIEAEASMRAGKAFGKATDATDLESPAERNVNEWRGEMVLRLMQEFNFSRRVTTIPLHRLSRSWSDAHTFFRPGATAAPSRADLHHPVNSSRLTMNLPSWVPDCTHYCSDPFLWRPVLWAISTVLAELHPPSGLLERSMRLDPDGMEIIQMADKIIKAGEAAEAYFDARA